MAANQPYTFADLKAELRPQLFPQGEADNLVAGHDADFIAALIEIQRWVQCQQLNNVSLYPQCNTTFKCGMTVLDKPRGQIRRVSVIDKINQTSGLEDSTQLTDWCSEVEYRQVKFEDLDSYVSQALAGTFPGGQFLPWLSGVLGGLNLTPFMAWPGFWFNKWSYPPPKDTGLQNAPPLPLGFHYGQPSTNAPNGNRAQFGLWAIKGGQIYVGPWIQSTETVLVEWDGLKRDWNDLDLVDGGDPTFKSAVLNWVGMEHERKWGHDSLNLQNYTAGYARDLAALIYDCDKENRISNGGDSGAGKARGSSFAVPEYFNQAQTATASCPQGQVGNPVSVTVPDNTVISLVSVADANARAQSQALQLAGTQLQCAPPPVTYLSAQQSFTASCGDGCAGTPSTVTLQAGAFTSTVSQADANSQALAAATAAAQAALVCSCTNDQQMVSVTCATNQQTFTTTIPAGTYTAQTKDLANAAAIAAANTANNVWLAANCPATPTLYTSTAQTACGTLACQCTNLRGLVSILNLQTCVTVNAGFSTSTTSQAEANLQAYNYALQLVQLKLQNACTYSRNHSCASPPGL